MEQSEFFFIPNLSDASPRVAAEALCRGTPLIMNRHIAGGWKYINDATGVFFDGVDDFLPAIQRLRALKAAGKLKPREWFRCPGMCMRVHALVDAPKHALPALLTPCDSVPHSANYGPRRSSLRLQAFIELAVGKERLERARQLPRKRW